MREAASELDLADGEKSPRVLADLLGAGVGLRFQLRAIHELRRNAVVGYGFHSSICRRHFHGVEAQVQGRSPDHILGVRRVMADHGRLDSTSSRLACLLAGIY